MKRVLTRRRRERRMAWLLLALVSTSALGIFAETPSWAVALALLVGTSIGAGIQSIAARSLLDLYRKGAAQRSRWLKQSFRMNRSLLDELKSANATSASLVGHVRRYQALITGKKVDGASPQEWKH